MRWVWRMKGKKNNRGGILREGDRRDALLDINIAWTFVEFIGVFPPLLNSKSVLNLTIAICTCRTRKH